MDKNKFICLGIETSCDETAVSIVRNGREILSDVVLSQIDLHSVYGGVVPEIACRAHIESILPTLIKALKDAHLNLADINAVAVTNRPGLIGALLVGVSVAKTIAWLLKKPLIPINHIESHLYVNNLAQNLSYPYIGLVVSGGHTTLFWVKSPLSYRAIGRTRDDAAGESFDKVAKILGLGYPGGPIIEKIAQKGNSETINFPRGLVSSDSLDFSFSGLKTSVLYYCKGQNASAKTLLKKGLNISDICASFQEAVVDTLIHKTLQAARYKKTRAIVLGGGVSCNERLRSKFQIAANKENIKLYLPPKKLCTDNAVMVAAMACEKYKKLKRLKSSIVQRNLYLDAFSTAE
ncbi:MAG: tRNA (adenosine(37)-N6)-threonylcarbamoyltransferase complex transferase subunit TsaD [Planctomycetota bacterium]